MSTLVLYVVVIALLGAIITAMFLALPQGAGAVLAIAAVITASTGLLATLLHLKSPS